MLHIDLAVSTKAENTLRCILNRNTDIHPIKVCTKMFIATVFIIVKIENLKNPLAVNYINTRLEQ